MGGRLQKFWQKWSLLGANPRVVSILKEGYILPFKIRPPLVRDPLIVSGYANPIRNLYLKEALHVLIHKKAVERVRVRTSLAFFSRLFIVPKPNQKWRPIQDLSALNKFLSVKTSKMETPDNPNLLTTRGMVDITGFQRRLFPHSNTQPVPGIPPVSLQKPNIPVPGLALWPLNSSYGVHLRGQRGQVDGSIAGYKGPPVPRRLVDSSPYQRVLPPGHPVPPRPLPGFGLGGESTKFRVGTQTNLRICGLPMRPITRAGQADQKPLGVNSTEGVIPPVQSDFSGQEVHVSDRPSHSNGKTGASGQTSYATHSVAPQGTLEASRVTGKGDPSPRDSSLTPSVADQGNKCLTGQPLHLLCHALQVFTDASSEGWGAHLGDFTANGSWSVPESRLDINFLELKAVLLALKRFQHIVQGQIVLDATDNTTVVAYINKEGGMRSGSICTLLWRLLCWCNLRHIVLKARHIPGHLNVIAGKLSRQGQIIQREWSLHQVFDLLCQTLHRPQVDMFATRYNCKLTKFVSTVPDPNTWAVDAPTVSWEDLDMYAFPPVSLLGKVICKLSYHLCKRVIPIAPGWPNMPWFWDLVDLSSQIPICLPNHPDLVTQPFNRVRHRDLTSLNLHALLLELRQSGSRGSLAQWRYKLRLLKDAQPEQSMRQSGPFLLDGVQQVRWTSGCHLSSK